MQEIEKRILVIEHKIKEMKKLVKDSDIYIFKNPPGSMRYYERTKTMNNENRERRINPGKRHIKYFFF